MENLSLIAAIGRSNELGFKNTDVKYEMLNTDIKCKC